MRLVQFLVLLALIVLSSDSFGQEIKGDSIIHPDETLYSDKAIDEAEMIEMHSKRYNPGVAGLFSAVVPGLGQAYNKKYWKIPLVYGAFIGIYITVDKYNSDYQMHRKGLLYALANDGFDNENNSYEIDGNSFSEDALRNRVNKHRRERDYWIILGGIWYLLNIADAHIDAHLKEFEVNDKLKLSVDPTLSQSMNSVQGGISLTLHFH